MAITDDNIYSETLQSLIDAKLAELAKKRDSYERSKALVQENLSSQSDEAEKVRVLKEGIKTCLKLRTTSDDNHDAIGHNTDLKQLLQNLDHFLEQPRYDPSLMSSQLQKWTSQLSRYLDVQSKRYTFAVLYGKLVTEWLGSEKRLGNNSDVTDAVMTDSFEELESSAKLRSRQDWEDVAYKPLPTDVEAIRSFLKAAFGEENGTKERVKSLNRLRERVSSFEQEMSSANQFDTKTLSWTIRGLLSGSRLSDDKQAVLKDFLNNNVVLLEIADVLNLRMSNLSDWTWGSSVPVVQRRELAGRYTMSMQEDLLQAIFVQYIGVKWSVFLKKALRKFITNHEAWQPLNQPVPILDRNRRTYYIGEASPKYGLNARRNTVWIKNYFMAQLLRSVHSAIHEVEGAEEACFDGVECDMMEFVAERASTGGNAIRHRRAGKAARKSAPSDYRSLRRLWMNTTVDSEDKDDSDDDKEDYERPDDEEGSDGMDDEDGNVRGRSLMDAKQDLLKILRTEILINKRLRGGLTSFRSRYTDWDSLLPHSTILAVAEYLGVSETWLKFFRMFLQVPLGLTVDGQMDDVRVRRRGVPKSHPLGDVLGEMILFCLDVSVNQATAGQRLWRIHDDLWFWSADHNTAVQAWTTITKFNTVMGLSLDIKTAGSIRVSRAVSVKVDDDTVLPQRSIRWGFLYLDSQTGQWEIDETMVDSHAGDLRKQLESKGGSVLSWVRAWNAYADTFFTTNFGKPAKCFGRAHTNKALSALERVQSKVFCEAGINNVVDHISTQLEQRFDISGVPSGYCFFPTVLGGLELRNPVIKLLLVRETMDKGSDPEDLLDFYEECEKDSYQKRKKIFEQGGLYRSQGDFVPTGKDQDEFMTFEEYVKYREVLGYNYENELREVYQQLLEECTEHQVKATSDISRAVGMMDRSGVIGQSSTINGNWDSMSPYWKWVTQLYGGEIVKAFGGLNIVDSGVLPVGMISLLRSERVAWKG